MDNKRFEGIESGNARRAKRPKTKQFSALPLGQHYPRHYPPRPGPFLGQPGPSNPSPADIGPIPGESWGKLGRPLSLRQVAALFGCSPWTVRQTLIPKGLPFFRSTASGRLTFFENQVNSWIESQQQGG